MENYQKNIVDPKYVYEKLDAKNFKVIDCTVYFELKKVGASTIHSGYEDYLLSLIHISEPTRPY